jgi:DNA-binding NtrC family response regulator
MSIYRKSILIIDDDVAMLGALKKVLSAEGALVTSASWGGDAMEHLTDKSERFDLVITDLRMPILGGQSILGAVSVGLPQVPVIVVTAFGDPKVRAECLRKGAAAFLEKPVDTPQLLAAIEGALTRGKADASPWARSEEPEVRSGCPPKGAPACMEEPLPTAKLLEVIRKAVARHKRGHCQARTTQEPPKSECAAS